VSSDGDVLELAVVTVDRVEPGERSSLDGRILTCDLGSLRDLALREETERALYINMPGLIAGMGYQRERMQSLFSRIRSGREQLVQSAYNEWQQTPDNEVRQAAFEAAMRTFEEQVGSDVRSQAQQHWQRKQAGDHSQAQAMAARARQAQSALQAVTEQLLPDRSEPAVPLEATNLQDLRDRLVELRALMPGDRELTALKLGQLGDDPSRELRASLRIGSQRITQLANSLRQAPRPGRMAVLQTRMQQATDSLQDAIGHLDRAAVAILQHNRRVQRMADRVLDPEQVPLLIPAVHRTATVIFGEGRYRYGTHQESRMAYFAEAFNLRGVTPAQAPPSAVDPHLPNQPAPRRAYEVFQILQARAMPLSEAKILAAIASGEGQFSSVQAIDRVRFSWGFIQFQGAALMGVLRRIQENSPETFSRYFERYGVAIAESGRTPTPLARQERVIPGAGGVPSREASGVEGLLVYDHRSYVWVGGNEALSVIQGDPRYQTLFVAAAQEPDVVYAQVLQARDAFVHSVRNERIRLASQGSQATLRVRDFANNEVVMFALVSRKVGSGNIAFASRMFNAYLAAEERTLEQLTTSPDQPGMAAFTRGYTIPGGSQIHWQRAENLEQASIQPLSDSDYVGAV